MIFGDFVYREFADPVVAKATLDFLNLNKPKILSDFPTLLPQVLSSKEINNLISSRQLLAQLIFLYHNTLFEILNLEKCPEFKLKQILH